MTISLDQIEELLRDVEHEVRQLGKDFDRPRFVSVNGVNQFRHAQKDDLLLSYLKCVRAVSALHASVLLLRHGHAQEVGALCRCVDEFCEDVLFLSVPLGSDGRYSRDQERLVKEFFQEEFPGFNNVMTHAPSRDRVPRHKVWAGIARIRGMPVNPYDAQQLHRVLGRAFSGYIHGAYTHIMEMYGGDSAQHCAFHMHGMSARVPEMLEALASYAYRLTLTIEIVARRCNDEAVRNKVTEVRSRFEDAAGIGSADAQTQLGRLKQTCGR